MGLPRRELLMAGISMEDDISAVVQRLSSLCFTTFHSELTLMDSVQTMEDQQSDDKYVLF